MYPKTRLTLRALLVGVILIGMMLACYGPSLFGPSENEVTYEDIQTEEASETAQALAKTIQANYQAAKAAGTKISPWELLPGTVHAPQALEAMFVDSDCPNTFPGLTAAFGAGSLDCRYHWTGQFGADNLELTIMQYTDSGQYQQAVESDLKNWRNVAANTKATGNNHKNDSANIISDDSTDFIYMETYDGSPRTDNLAIPLCGYGWGIMGVHNKFEVTLQLTDACDISTHPSDYSQALISLRDAAMTAIARAEANKAP